MALNSSERFTTRVADYAPMLEALRALFDASAVDGRVSFDYDTRVFAGTLGDRKRSGTHA